MYSLRDNDNLLNISSIIDQVKIRPNLEYIDVDNCPRLPGEQMVTLNDAMELPRGINCSLLVLRSAQEVRRLSGHSAMKRFPKDLTRMLSNFLK